MSFCFFIHLGNMERPSRAQKLVRLWHCSTQMPWPPGFLGERWVELQVCSMLVAGKGLHYRAARLREKRENWHCEQAAKCLNLCQAHPGTGGIYWFEALFWKTQQQKNWTQSITALPCSPVSSCIHTLSLDRVHLQRRRRWDFLQDPAERLFCHFITQQKDKVLHVPMESPVFCQKEQRLQPLESYS